jgi:hypothetical protein
MTKDHPKVQLFTVLEDAKRLVTVWNERQSKRMPMLFSPTIGAAIAAGYWFLWVAALPAAPQTRSTCARPSPRRSRDQSYSGAVLPLLSAKCTICRARATSKTSIAEQMRERCPLDAILP